MLEATTLLSLACTLCIVLSSTQQMVVVEAGPMGKLIRAILKRVPFIKKRLPKGVVRTLIEDPHYRERFRQLATDPKKGAEELQVAASNAGKDPKGAYGRFLDRDRQAAKKKLPLWKRLLYWWAP